MDHTHPVTPERFEDFAVVVNRNRRETHCWCLSHRLSPKEIDDLGGGSRERAMREVCAEHPPGVVTYREGEPVGWCSISPRARIPRLVRSRVIRPVDDVEPWCIICVVVRPGHRRQGITRQLIEGAVQWAASQGAVAVESYPVDAGGRRIDTTMAFVGTRAMFEAVGFTMIGTTGATGSGLPPGGDATDARRELSCARSHGCGGADVPGLRVPAVPCAGRTSGRTSRGRSLRP